jgi:phage terminase large subunit-like protein
MRRRPRPPQAAFAELVALPAAERLRRIARLSAEEAAELLYDWSLWARDNQRPPPGDWVTWLILAGRGAGKTRTGAETVRAWTRTYPLVNLIGATRHDAREIMVEGESGILAVCPPHERPRFIRASDRLEWPNGAKSLVFSAEEPDRLRGKQHMKLWADELAAWRDPDAFDQAMLGLRLGDRPQAIVTTTPRPTPLIKHMLNGAGVVVTRGSTFDNAKFLPDGFLTQILGRFEGRALERQEIYGEIVEEAPGALWTRALIERQRLPADAAAAEYSEIVIAVDPPARSGPRADECGVIAAGRTRRGDVHVLADLTSQGETPGQWSARVAAAYHRFAANRVVAEINNGGEMVTQVLRQNDANLPVRTVTATRGKFLRAEPVAAAYERGVVFHCGVFAKLEDQLCTLTSDFDARGSGFSPDRADALVWAVSDLLSPSPTQARTMLDYYARQAKGEI